MEPPRVGAFDATMATLGVATCTTVVLTEFCAGTGLYAVSPG